MHILRLPTRQICTCSPLELEASRVLVRLHFGPHSAQRAEMPGSLNPHKWRCILSSACNQLRLGPKLAARVPRESARTRRKLPAHMAVRTLSRARLWRHSLIRPSRAARPSPPPHARGGVPRSLHPRRSLNEARPRTVYLSRDRKVCYKTTTNRGKT